MAAEYRIVASLDPAGVSAGKAKVKQDLRELDTVAAKTKGNLEKTFSGPELDRALGQMATRLAGVETALGKVSAQSGRNQQTNTALTGTIERMTAAEFRAAGGAEGMAKASKDAAQTQGQLHAATLRVLGAVDAEAAELVKLNALLADAQRLYQQGAITADQFARVQTMVNNTGKQAVQQTGAQRIGLQQLGFQLGDVATMYSLGAKPAQIFGSQIGQVTQAVQLMSGGTSKFAGFLGGPWGIALSVGLIALTPLVAKLLEGGDALDQEIEKLKKDAEQSALTAEAKRQFGMTVEGVTQSINDQNEALKKSQTTARQAELDAYALAKANLKLTIDTRTATEALLEQAVARERLYTAGLREQLGAEGAAGFDQAHAADLARVTDLEGKLAASVAARTAAEEALRRSEIPINERAVAESLDGSAAATGRYETALQRLNNERARGIITQAAYITALRKEQTIRDAAIAADREADRKPRKPPSDGVSRFRSREQAIGVAGREFQRDGLRVSENVQFGGVQSNHPGMGNVAHGKYAVDVNSGSGVTEANVPDLKSKFDALARRYQARGYRVLWNGMVWEANGNGPTRPITKGSMHYDHMHVEAPQTIVGKPTQASSEAQASREENQAATAAEQQADFVQQFVDQQAGRGLPDAAGGSAQLDRAMADFKRRFNKDMEFDDKWKIATAIDEAEARENALHFDEAYVKPLEQLRKLEGLVGVERDIEAAKQAERLRLRRDLTDAESAQIEAFHRDGNELDRKAQLLAEIKGPMQEYIAYVTALNGLLGDGSINLTSYNARLAALAAEAAGSIGGLGGVDPGTGKSYADIQAGADENARYAEQLQNFELYREELLKLGVDYDALTVQAALDHQQRLREIDAARKDQQLGAAQDIMGSLLQITESTVGKQNALYKAMFAVEKAVAIARAVVAIQTGIAQAAALPFPANLGAIASVVAATASIVSNIQAVALNFADGGHVRGRGTGRSDSVPANLSNGEFVVNASATRQNKALLEAINDGRQVGGQRNAVIRAEAAGAQRPRVQVHNYAGAAVETRENLTTGDVEVMIKQGVERHAPRAVARGMQDPSSEVSKSMTRNLSAGRRRD